MGKFHRFYKNMTGSTIYVSDMNNWEIKPDAEVDLELVPEDLLSRSIHFGKLIALNKLVALPERVTKSNVAPPPAPVYLTPEIVRDIARQVGQEIAKAMLQAQVDPTPVAPREVAPEPLRDAPVASRGAAAREEIDREIDEARIRMFSDSVADKVMSVGGVTSEIVEEEDTEHLTKPLAKVMGKQRRGPMSPGIRKQSPIQ